MIMPQAVGKKICNIFLDGWPLSNVETEGTYFCYDFLTTPMKSNEKGEPRNKLWSMRSRDPLLFPLLLLCQFFVIPRRNY